MEEGEERGGMGEAVRHRPVMVWRLHPQRREWLFITVTRSLTREKGGEREGEGRERERREGRNNTH